MKTSLLFILIAFSAIIYGQEKPRIDFITLMEMSEITPYHIAKATQEIEADNLPVAIYLPEGIYIEAMGVEDGKTVYAIMKDLLNPYNGGETAFFEEIESRYNLSQARVTYSNGYTTNKDLGYPTSQGTGRETSFLMFLENTNKRVIAIDRFTGNVLNNNLVTGPSNLGTVKQARLSPRGTITMSDQTQDVVYEIDTNSTFMGIFAPAGGVNVAILDNIRGHDYYGGNLFVSVGAGGNVNSIARFDNSGNFTGQFIATGAGGLDSPFDLLFRNNDLLVAGYGNGQIPRYDLNGNFINLFTTMVVRPQQIVEGFNAEVVIADFGVGGGLRRFSSTGDSIALYNVVTACRGAWQLQNGNYLVTNAAGLHEVNSNNQLLRTIVSGVSGQYISQYDRSIIPVELVSFTALPVGSDIHLKWNTASELNNKGFEIEKNMNEEWINLGYVEGSGTKTETTSYQFIDYNSGAGSFSYRLKQIDFDGSYTYSHTVTGTLSSPEYYTIEQNYPNPFNPETIIKFSIPQEGFVSLRIFNILGEESATLLNEYKPAGSYTVSFDGANLTSGTYFYTLKSGEFSVTKKMLLLK
jgi:hypothetical protein